MYLTIFTYGNHYALAVRGMKKAGQTEAAGRVSLGGKLTFEVEEIMGRELGG